MSRFEELLVNKILHFSRICLEYVDDIFAIFDLDKCTTVIEFLTM